MKPAAVILVCAVTLLIMAQTSSLSATQPGSTTEAMYRAAAQSAETKLRHIQTNGKSAHPNQTPTVITEREINAYLSSGTIRLPNGVTQIRLTGTSGTTTANALVDFDKITQSRRSSNLLMSLFTGVHQVEVISHAQGIGGQARVHVDSASIDGIAVPRIALEFFADRYIRPKHPNLGIDSQFALPDKINTASIGDHSLIIIQK